MSDKKEYEYISSYDGNKWTAGWKPSDDKDLEKINTSLSQKADSTDIKPYEYVMTTFASNSDRTLSILVSDDGVNWETLIAQAYTAPSGTVRDPSIVYYDGVFYCVYSKNDTAIGNDFGFCKSVDLVTWTHIADVGMGSVSYVWAPELFVDTDGLHVFVALGVSDKNNFDIYEAHPTSDDLLTWSAPAQLHGDFDDWNTIDPFMYKEDGIYYLWYKDATHSGMQFATSENMLSGYVTYKTGDWQGFGGTGGSGYNEGESIIKLSNGKYRLYWDNYNELVQYYSDSEDMHTWTLRQAVTSDMTLRHFTVLSSPAITKGLSKYAITAAKATNGGYQTYTPAITWATSTPTGIAIKARYRKIGKSCHVMLRIDCTDGNGTTGLTVPLPSELIPKTRNGYPIATCWVQKSGSAALNYAYVTDDGLTQLIKFYNFGTANAGSALVIDLSVWYETL
jgi:hypothetical protein